MLGCNKVLLTRELDTNGAAATVLCQRHGHGFSHRYTLAAE